jgi:hypothetical protein
MDEPCDRVQITFELVHVGRSLRAPRPLVVRDSLVATRAVVELLEAQMCGFSRVTRALPDAVATLQLGEERGSSALHLRLSGLIMNYVHAVF